MSHAQESSLNLLVSRIVSTSLAPAETIPQMVDKVIAVDSPPVIGPAASPTNAMAETQARTVFI